MLSFFPRERYAVSVERAFTFFLDFDKARISLAAFDIADYTVELDDDWAGSIAEGDVVTYYFLARYEGVSSFCVDISYRNIEPGKAIHFCLEDWSSYDEKTESWVDIRRPFLLPEGLRFVIFFEPDGNGCAVRYGVDTAGQPLLVKLLFPLACVVGWFQSGQDRKRLKALLEAYK